MRACSVQVQLVSVIGASLLLSGCGPSGGQRAESTPPPPPPHPVPAEAPKTPAPPKTEVVAAPQAMPHPAAQPAQPMQAAQPPQLTVAPAPTPPPLVQVPQPAPIPVVPSPAQTAVPAAATVAAALPATAAGVAPTLESSVTDMTSQLLMLAQARTNQVLASIGNDLGNTVKTLGQKLSDQPALRDQLMGTVTSLVRGKDAEAVGLAQGLADKKLTPEQTQLVKEVRDLASAYVVQKNFSNLEGSTGEVAQAVSSLRSGQPLAALPPIYKTLQNARLTPPQKELLSSIAGKYAPGIKKTGDSLKEGLKSLKALGGQ